MKYLPEEEWSDSPEVKCPWCHELNTDLWEFPEGNHDFICGNCDRPLRLGVAMSTTYSLSPIKTEGYH